MHTYLSNALFLPACLSVFPSPQCRLAGWVTSDGRASAGILSTEAVGPPVPDFDETFYLSNVDNQGVTFPGYTGLVSCALRLNYNSRLHPSLYRPCSHCPLPPTTGQRHRRIRRH